MKCGQLRCLVVAFAASAVLAACGPQGGGGTGGPGDAENESRTVGACLLTQTHIFYQEMVDAMQQEADKHNIRLQVQYCEFDSAKQNDQVQTFLAKGADALIIAPNDSAGVRPVIEDARSRGVPVFTVDIAAHDADVVSHIASDNVEGGRLIARYLAKALDGTGQVAIIDHPEVASVQDRVAGFEEVLAQYPNIEIVAKAPGGGKRDVALIAAQDVLQSNPDLDAVFGINDDSALGALAAVEAAGLGDALIIVGYDGTPEARQAILKGTALKADTVQHPRAIGTTAIQIVADYFGGRAVPKEVPVAVEVIDQESLRNEAQGDAQ